MNTSDNCINFKTHGRLAYVFCGKRLPLVILKAQAFYIGTFDDDGPCSRESNEYFDTREQAELALKNGNWTQKVAP